MPEFINILLDTLVISAKNENFKIEKALIISNFMFTSLQIILLFYITNGNVSCINKNILDVSQNSITNMIVIEEYIESYNSYINNICSSSIKWDSFIMYIDRIILLSILILYMYTNSHYLSKSNRYDSIRTNQKFEDYIGDKLVEKSKNYKKELKKSLIKLLISKIIFTILLSTYIIYSIFLSIFYNDYIQIFLLDSIKCNLDKTWNFGLPDTIDNISNIYCHFDNSYVIFILWIITNIIFLLNILVNIGSIINNIWIIWKFDKLFKDINENDIKKNMSINYVGDE